MPKTICFFEFWNVSPHFETTLELALDHLKKGDIVYYFFCGRDTLLNEQKPISKRFLFSKWPEEKGADLIRHDNFHFFSRIDVSKIIVPIFNYNSLDELKKLSFELFPIGLGVLSTLISEKKVSYPDINKFESEIKFLISTSYKSYQFALSKLSELSPDLVYIFNGRFSNHRAILSAVQKLNVPFLIHERGANNSKYYLQPFMSHNVPRLKKILDNSWKTTSADPLAIVLAHDFFKNQRLRKPETYPLEIYNQISGRLPQIDLNKRIVTYFASSDFESLALGDFVFWEYWENQLEAVSDLIDIVEKINDIQLIIRLHPNFILMEKNERKLWTNLGIRNNVLLVEAEEEIDSYALLDISHLVVTCGSTIGIESVYNEKPTISLGPPAETWINGIILPKGKIELEELITGEWLKSNFKNALPYGYYIKTFGENYKYYKSNNFFEGEFLGVNLQRMNIFQRIWIKVSNLFSK